MSKLRAPSEPRRPDPVEIVGNVFYNEDCTTGVRRHIPDTSIDLVITDPPYGIDGHTLHKHYNRDERFVVDGYVEVPRADYQEFSNKWIREAERILKPGGQIYIVSGYTNLYEILHALRQTSVREVNHLIWKYNFGVFTRTKYVSSHYHILFYEKPGARKRKFNVESRFGLAEKADAEGSPNYRDREDVWVINREYKPGEVKNKNELPTALLVKMIQYSSVPGDTICDMFMGGFSTARVAVGLGRNFVGFEVSEPIFKRGVKEMETLRPGFLLSHLRRPTVRKGRNERQRWSPESVAEVMARYRALVDSGRTKKESIATLGDEFGRGRWAIEKLLKKHVPRLAGTTAPDRPSRKSY